jgi:hypothetical protein
MIRLIGLGPWMPRMNAAPSNAAAGNSFTISTPNSSALDTSVAVPQPGKYGTRRRLHRRATSDPKMGLTMNSAPASMNIAAVGAS